MDSEAHKRTYKTIKTMLVIVRIVFMVTIAVSALLFYLYTDMTAIPDNFKAMEPTIPAGSKLLVRTYPSESSLQRFTVVFFMTGASETGRSIGRIIGMPGETVSSQNNIIYINGNPLDETFYPSGHLRAAMPEDIPEYRVAEGKFFILVDNRGYSGVDSRDFGAITSGNIESKLLVKF